MRRAAETSRPIVVKVGSSSLSSPGSGLDSSAVQRVVDQVEALWRIGHPTLLVTSGAVSAGLPVLGLDSPPTDLPGSQVAAAVGQSKLMESYGAAFGTRSRVTAQVLLTRDVLARREQYLHSREALERMLDLGVVPIVNENDTVVVDELKLGDNDRLAAIVSHLIDAAMLIILTDTPGLYSEDPRLQPQAELIGAVRHTDDILDELWSTSSKGVLGSGGVATKIAAARMAAWSGIPTVIAPANDLDVTVKAVAGEEVGTWIDPHPSKLPARKLWIAFGLPSRGRLTIDEGARNALVAKGSSLLSVGVTGSEGDFVPGDAVEIFDAAGSLVGKGLCRAAAESVAATTGVLVHRDDLVVLA
ncbi:MAG: glutamate 5-kinase [Acidimicrobiia bacterium]|nr:glutamate 5-kinase [Acidimicrobiia bacterium]